ncbi:amidase signature domain-containing protein [Massariosphaeria phaeospora]|uniref:Amidase signature domain-containing protein n=1 Tax=Massariosphaeria phaeospora TaxID=100035 RepID=A0A7C8IKE4_9PLEO|nr:amidase signature domain-containing protein [Massariosphaeria phaeospora]
MGYIGWIDTYQGSRDKSLVHQMNSQVVSDLLAQGAILYCKTSLPQTLLFGETVNNLVGTTLNPVNRNLSCGGSSGGEGALQALRGSIVGLGTDIGGSVRIPAAFNGIYSIRPTHSRLSYREMADVIPGQTTYPLTVGVLGTSLDAIHLVFTSILATQPWLRDPQLVPRGYTTQAGDILDRQRRHAASPIARGLRTLADAARKAGHTVVDWNPPDQRTAKRVHVAFLLADGGRDVHKQLELSGEPLIPPLRDTFRLREPMSLIKYQELTLEGLAYEAAYSVTVWSLSCLTCSGASPTLSYTQYNLSSILQYSAHARCPQSPTYSDYWNNTGQDDGQMVDAFIMPVAPHAAVIPGKFYHTAYTESINLLDYSVVVIPVTKADKSIDRADPDYAPLNNVNAKNWSAYDVDVYDGAPVGVQIVARKYEEEKVWAVVWCLRIC